MAAFDGKPVGDVGEFDFRTVVDVVPSDIKVEVIDLIDGAVEGVGHVEAEPARSGFDRVFVGAFDFDITGNPGPSVDIDFDVAKFPLLAVGFLFGFRLETESLDKVDSFVEIIDFEADFFHARESETVEMFVAHGDAVAFVADASERMFVDIKNRATHEGFGLDESGAGGSELVAKLIFVNIDESGFDFGFHRNIVAQEVQG